VKPFSFKLEGSGSLKGVERRLHIGVKAWAT